MKASGAPARLEAYRTALEGCRFCPMCKPAGEVLNLTQLEGHSTRGRAMLLWRILSGHAGWDTRTVELIYQATLDSLSEAWCISHYPVSGYVAAARAEVMEAGLAPASVLAALEDAAPEPEAVRAEVVLLGAEAVQAAQGADLGPAVRALERARVPVQTMSLPSGALAYALGDQARARDQAQRVARALRDAGARMVVADGPQTAWALRAVYPALGVSLPDGVAVTTLTSTLAAAARDGRLATSRHGRLRVLVHDSRAAALLADTMAQAEAIQPGYRGPEDGLGTGEVFEASRRLLDELGASRIPTVWSRSLCRSCGADDGLALTFPALARGLARQQLDEARRLAADAIVCDSLLCATHLAGARFPEDVPVRWLPALLEGA